MVSSNKFTFIILILTTTIIQWHSIQFWIEVADSIGFLWSIAIEASAIWLWWNKKTILALVASLLLMTGPLYSLSIPAYKSSQSDIASAASHQQQIILAQETIGLLKQSLLSYQENSLSRVGWASRIDETQKALQVEVEGLKQLIKNTVHLKQTTIPWLIIAIELLGLVVLLITQVLTIRTLRSVSSVSKQSEMTGDSKQEYSKAALVLSSRLSDTLDAEGLSQAEWARRNEISAKSVSMLINHQKRAEAGKECISKNELNGIRNALG